MKLKPGDVCVYIKTGEIVLICNWFDEKSVWVRYWDYNKNPLMGLTVINPKDLYKIGVL